MSSSRNNLPVLERVVPPHNGRAPQAVSAKMEAQSPLPQQEEELPVLFSDSDVMPHDIVSDVIVVSDSDDDRGDSNAELPAHDDALAPSAVEQSSPQHAADAQQQQQQQHSATPVPLSASASSSSSSVSPSSSPQPTDSSPRRAAAASAPLPSSPSPHELPPPPRSSLSQSPAAATVRNTGRAEVSLWRIGGGGSVQASIAKHGTAAVAASALSSSLSNGKRAVSQLSSPPSPAPAAKRLTAASDDAGDGSDTEDDEIPPLIAPPARLTNGMLAFRRDSRPAELAAAAAVRTAAAPPQAAAAAAHRSPAVDSDPHRRRMNGVSNTAAPVSGSASTSASFPSSLSLSTSALQPSEASVRRDAAAPAPPASVPLRPSVAASASASLVNTLMPPFLNSLLACASSAPFMCCFSCQCPIVDPVCPSCSECHARYHPSCCAACPRHQCCLCPQPQSSAASVSSSLYHCLLCPRSFCFRHATAATSAFSSLPSLPSMSRFGPALISLLVAHALRSQDCVPFYLALPRAQLGVCQECATEVEEEETWRRMQGKRRWRRIAREQAAREQAAREQAARNNAAAALAARAALRRLE